MPTLTKAVYIINFSKCVLVRMGCSAEDGDTVPLAQLKTTVSRIYAFMLPHTRIMNCCLRPRDWCGHLNEANDEVEEEEEGEWAVSSKNMI